MTAAKESVVRPFAKFAYFKGIFNMFTVFSFKLASIEVWKQSISSQGCIFGLEFKPDGTSWRKSPCEICHCEVGVYIYCLGHCRNVRGLGKSMVVFLFFEKLRYSNERSSKIERLYHE